MNLTVTITKRFSIGLFRVPKNPHFQNEARCTTFLVKMHGFYLHDNEKSFPYQGEVFNLVLIQRPGGTKKWPIFMKGSFGNKVQDKKQGRKIKPLADPGEGPGGPGPSPFLSQGLDDMRYVMINILPQQCFFKTLTTSMRSILTRVRTKSLIVRPGQT